MKKCLRCAWEWLALVDDPRTCPRCKSYSWNTPLVRRGMKRKPQPSPKDPSPTPDAA